MKQGIDIAQLQKKTVQFLHRYHVIIFVLTVIGGLSLATFMINQSITDTTTDQPAATTQNFDQDTMNKIKALRKTSDEPAPLSLPDGRVNPFI